MKQPKIALLTNCTESAHFPPLVCIEDAPLFKTMDELCLWWTEEMDAQRGNNLDELRTPGELYKGLSFDTVTEIAQVIGHSNIYVINRGGGLVRYDKKMVPYNFTYARDEPKSAWHKVTGEKFMPSLWWTKINLALHGEQHPISQIKTEDGEDYDYIITSLTGDFIRLISADLARLPDRTSRLLMPITRSSAASIPRSIRSSCIPYTVAYTQDVDFSRYNKSHRMTQKFLMTGLEDGNLLKHANEVRDAQNALDESHVTTQVTYDELFKKHPELLKAATVESAMSIANMQGLRVGSHTKFVGAWRGAHGTQEIEATAKEIEGARASLRSVMSSMNSGELLSNEDLLKQIGLFLEAVKEEDITLVFSSKEVATWGRLVYGDEAKKKRSIGSGAKVASMLRTHTAYLGLEVLNIGSMQAYRIKVDE